MSETLLEIRDLSIAFPAIGGEALGVSALNLEVQRGEAVAVVGESGCGKTLTALAPLALIPKPGRIVSGEVFYNGRAVSELPGRELRRFRGREVAMVFQEPMTSLNPVFSVGYQLGEAVDPEGRVPRKVRDERAIELLREVGVPDPERRLKVYPHQLSGGLRQRVMIAAALAGEPSLLIADEPTTALDVTVEAQIMELLEKIRRERGMALMLITHDLGVVAQYAERVVVMYGGMVVEEAPVAEIFNSPLHPYTEGLLASLPKRGRTLEPIPGNVPSLGNFPEGCPFRERCPREVSRCAQGVPDLSLRSENRKVRCVRVGEDG
ncbi:MAG: peptide ABC transporter ATP-binding protein [Deltaproteobacteria bacterium]|nr:MAG: peptide ABC transporter ATP-binding protein [Deltaproteobacteria bacterium]